jgi:transposase
LDWSVSNVLKVTHQEAIRSLHEKGWSRRRIARELGIHRRTVDRYVGERAKCTSDSTAGGDGEPESKCTTILTAGSAAGTDPKLTGLSTPSSKGTGDLKSAAPSEASAGRKSRCEPLAESISTKWNTGLSAQRIYQDLVEENGFAGSYQSVKRFVQKLKQTQPVRVWRMEAQPAEEMQVDFGLGAPIEDGSGKTRRTWVLRGVLSYSRKGYSEAVLRQDTETFIRCLENAVRSFGGSPQLLNLDNLKAAVLKADWFDPQINPKLAEFCRHYGMHVMPCRPRTPQHKGKVERGVGYVRHNALKGRRFQSLAAENQFLRQWEENVADKRIHGTTCQQVAARFAQERAHLQALPDSLFACYQEARRTVSRDSFVEVQRAFYEVPPEYIGRQVWVRWDGRSVRIFNERLEPVQMHTQIEPGKFSRVLGAQGMSRPVLSSCRWWIERASMLGEHCQQWAQSAVDTRGPEALRAIMALCELPKKHTAAAVDAACRKALAAGTRRLKDIQRLIGEAGEQTAFAFAESHPLIRDLKTYSDFICHHHQPSQQDDHENEQPPNPQATCPESQTLGAA